MATPNNKDHQHFLLCPLMAQGHMIPMVDMARLFAQRGIYVSFITTPLNALRVRPAIDRASRFSNLRIRLVELRFPCTELGLPEGSENVDVIPPSLDLFKRFFEGTELLKHPLERFLSADRDFPPPTCVVSDMFLPWTLDVARGLGIPRFVFHGPCSYSLIVMESARRHGLHCAANRPEEEIVAIPDMPCWLEMKRGQLPVPLSGMGLADFEGRAVKAEAEADGVVVNSFDELEAKFTEAYEKLMGKKAYNVGPLSLCEGEVQSERGNKSSIDQDKCLSWLDSHEPGSVVYVCFGSMARLGLRQAMEIGEALKGSGRPVVWVIKQGETEAWVSRFGEALDWLVIVGWAPQVAILSHKAVGGFVTHCGWNSTLEGLCAAVPMVTWPHRWEQFVNEGLVVEVLKVGVRVGIEVQTGWGKEVLVGREEIGVALERVMSGGEEGEERRRSVREIGEMAKKAMEVGGSSYVNMTRLIEDVKGYVKKTHPQLLSLSSSKLFHGDRSKPSFTTAHFRASSDVPDFLSSDWLESRRRRPFGPRLNFTAEEAVQYQLDALKYNDQPRQDYGVEVLYRFAGFDPFERSTYFGPFFDLGQFERFRRIFHHSTYRVLLGHKERKILSNLWVKEDRFKQRVWIRGSRPEEEETFEFTMVQRVGGSWDGYWLTESLHHDGDGFSGGLAY